MVAKTVLVVDDVSSHLMKLKDIVEASGYTVITASSGKEAIDIAKSNLPDMIFLDIVMDDVDGYGACREIVGDETTKDIPIVFVSTKNQRADRLWAAKQGARALVTKPYTDDEIREQLKQYL